MVGLKLTIFKLLEFVLQLELRMLIWTGKLKTLSKHFVHLHLEMAEPTKNNLARVICSPIFKTE